MLIDVHENDPSGIEFAVEEIESNLLLVRERVYFQPAYDHSHTQIKRSKRVGDGRSTSTVGNK